MEKDEKFGTGQVAEEETVAEKTVAEAVDTAALESKLQQAENALAKATEELQEAKETLMRTAAEYDNYRKRTTAEKDASFNNGVGFAVNKLLDLLDTLEMAESAETSDPEYKKGVTLTLSKAHDIFKLLGVGEIEAMGHPFDPNLHAAMMQEDAEDGVESGTITKVLKKGYAMGDKVIRHACVCVAN